MKIESKTNSLPNRARLPLTLAAICFVGAALVGCGGGYRDYEGDIFVENATDLTAPDDLISFQLAAVGEGFSPDLLSADLPPGTSEFIGTFDEDYYYATGELFGGDIIDWPADYVGYERSTVFEAR